jgi:hypothetical protein
MTYACPAWEFTVGVTKQVFLHHLKFSKVTPVRDLHMSFNLPYVYDYVTTLCRQQAEVIQNHENKHISSTGQGEARHRKYKKLKLGGNQAYDRSSD